MLQDDALAAHFPIMPWGGVNVLHVLLQPVLSLLDVFTQADAVHQLDLADGPPAVEKASEEMNTR